MERVGRMQENARYANATERACGFAGDDSGFTQTGGDQPTRGGPDSLDRMCEGAFEARLNTLQGGDLYLNYGAPIFDVVTLGRVIPAGIGCGAGSRWVGAQTGYGSRCQRVLLARTGRKIADFAVRAPEQDLFGI